MSQQEMGYEGSHYEQNPEYAQHPQHSQHYSDQYSQGQFAQKLPRRTLSKRAAMRIQLWTAYLSLLLVMIVSIVYAGQYEYGDTIDNMVFIWYSIIIVLNILVFVVVNFSIKVTRKLRQ